MPAGLNRATARAVAAVAVLAGPFMGAGGVEAVSPNADATAATLIVTVSAGSVGLVPGTVPVTFSGGCLGPFVDVSSISVGTAVSGPSCGTLAATTTGSYVYVGCTTGVLTGSASFTEPSGAVVAIQNFLALFIGGAGVFVASPSSSGGYVDDGSTGTMVGGGIMTPLDSTTCGPPGATLFGVTAAFGAEYGTGV